MMERSDKYYTHICDKSGRIAIVNPTENLFFSPDIDGPMNYDIIETLDLDEKNKGQEIQELLGPNTFKQHETEFFRAYMPYCAKLLIQECEGMGISVKLRSEKSKPLKQEVRDKKYESEMIGPNLKTDEEREEFNSLKEYLKERFSPKNQEENDDEDENEEKEEKEEKDKEKEEEEKEKKEEKDKEKEEKEEEKEDKEDKENDQSGGVNENLFNYFSMEKDDLISRDRDMDKDRDNIQIQQSGGSLSSSPLGEQLPFKMSNINDLGDDLVGGSMDKISITPIKTAFAQFDRPLPPDLINMQPQSSPSLSPSPSPPQQTGGSNDIKVINLDPNYLMKDDAFEQQQPQQPQQFGGSPQQPKQFGGSPQQPKQFGGSQQQQTQQHQQSQQQQSQQQQSQQQQQQQQPQQQQKFQEITNEIFIQ
jgi:hypothetical protein